MVPFLGALPEGLVAHGQIELAPSPEGHHHQPLLPECNNYIGKQYNTSSTFHMAKAL